MTGLGLDLFGEEDRIKAVLGFLQDPAVFEKVRKKALNCFQLISFLYPFYLLLLFDSFSFIFVFHFLFFKGGPGSCSELCGYRSTLISR